MSHYMKTEDQVRNEADKILGFNGGGVNRVLNKEPGKSLPSIS
jgi:hypothetical protein